MSKQSNLTEAEKEAKRAYWREYYKRRKLGVKKEDLPKEEKPMAVLKSRKTLQYDTPDYMTVKRYPNGMILIESSANVEELPEDIDKFIYKAKKQLERILDDIDKEERIIVIDKYDSLITVEVYVKSEKNILLIINELQTFCEKLIKNIAAQLVF